MARRKLTQEGKVDRTHFPKPNSGWHGESERHREAALKGGSKGGIVARARSLKSNASRKSTAAATSKRSTAAHGSRRRG